MCTGDSKGDTKSSAGASENKGEHKGAAAMDTTDDAGGGQFSLL